jgi:thioredoxin 1
MSSETSTPSSTPSVQHYETEEEFYAALNQATEEKTVVFLKFSAKWCAPCHAIAPLFESLATQHQEDAVFIHVDVDEFQDVATKFGISAMPTFLAVKDGEVVGSMKGANSKGLKELVQMAAPSLEEEKDGDDAEDGHSEA